MFVCFSFFMFQTHCLQMIFELSFLIVFLKNYCLLHFNSPKKLNVYFVVIVLNLFFKEFGRASFFYSTSCL